jgi:hypothetical protein
LTLAGLLLAGGLDVTTSGDARLSIADTTLVPGRALTVDGSPAHAGVASLNGAASAGTLSVAIARSIVGPLRLPLETPTSTLTLTDSIVDGMAGPGLAITGFSATIERSTVLGRTELAVLSRASESIFTELVTVRRTQEGCCRFCFIPEGSKAPRAYRCQPGLALQGVTDVGLRQAILERVLPDFTSRRYLEAGYAQLDSSCALEIREGAEDESEMGVFQFLHQPQREANLRAAVDEYLRFGLEAGLFLVT